MNEQRQRRSMLKPQQVSNCGLGGLTCCGQLIAALGVNRWN